MKAEPYYLEFGNRADSAIHATMITAPGGVLSLELCAIRSAVKDGRPLKEAAQLYASAGTREWMLGHGYPLQ